MNSITNPENVTATAGRDVAITAIASPRPWSLFVHEEEVGGDGEISICAENEWIATMNLRRSTAKADAALIVDAVNQYDRLAADEARYRAHNVVLRDIVRRLADLTTNLLANYEYRYCEDRNSMEFVGSARRFIAEARRAAILEGDAPCAKS